MTEYEELGHMTPIDVTEEQARSKKRNVTPVYVPHHGVVQQTALQQN
jgi:hypothetical protein